MSKKTLKALFHMDTNKYKEEYQRRFNAEDTIRLPINIGGSQAFICQTPELYKKIVSIERLDKKAAVLYNSLPGIALEQFTNKCLIDEILLSNDIEGVVSTRREIGEILQDLSAHSRRNRFVGLVAKYAALGHHQTISFRTCADIRKVYDDIFYEEIKTNDPENLPDGEIFRRSRVDVLSASQKVIHRGLSPESLIIEALESSLAVLNDDNIDILIRIAVFHYLFGYIHPFYDGNGRTSRFISSCLLSRHLTPLIGFRLSYTVKENISKYYKAFAVCNDPLSKGELTSFAEMFLEIIEISVRQLSETLEDKKQKWDFYCRNIKYLPNADKADIADLYDLLIQAALFSDIGISRSELTENMRLSENTVRKRIKLIPETLLIENRRKNNKYYMLDLNKTNELLAAGQTDCL